MKSAGMKTGLSSQEATERLRRFGENSLPGSQSRNILQIAGEVVREPMFLLLLACGTLYLLLGDIREGIILLCTIFIIIGITFFQYRKTERALEALKKLSAPRVLVIRDGQQQRIPGASVVPGDLVILNEGDRIAADAKLLETNGLSVDESILTGESVQVEKDSVEGKDHVYSGTLVVKGSGLAEVQNTGSAAKLGQIAKSLEQVSSEQTRLQAEMKILLRRLGVAGIIISASVVLLFYITRGHFLQALLNGLSASMAILPEEFPVVLTVFLALGAWRLSKKNVLTRKPSAIETLGSATVLCSDKTGTITQNKMQVVALYDGRELLHREKLSNLPVNFTKMVVAAYRASAADPVDPMEKAIHQLHQQQQWAATEDKLLKEYSLSRQLLAMTRVIHHDDGSISISAKGAPEAIFGLCRMSAEEKLRHQRVLNELGEKGCRMLAVAVAMHEGPLPDQQDAFHFKFAGLLALEDPIRPEVPAAIRECDSAGIQVKMITGDFAATASSIARQAGFTDVRVLSGADIEKLDDQALRVAVQKTNVFARVTPEQKLRIVYALKANNEVVAMTGDGVNDAPALKAADIGIAMGGKGSDVAREAASLVLLDDNFASIVAAVRMGRRIYDNLQKAMSYIIAIHIPIIGLTLIPALVPGLPLFLLPLHIVFMELIIDPACSVAFESETEEKNVMQHPPRDPSKKFFGFRQMFYSLVQGLMLLAIVLLIFTLSEKEGHTEAEIRAIGFSTLITGNIFLILANLSSTRSFLSVFWRGNWSALLILLLSASMLAMVMAIPALRQIFNFEYPGTRHMLPALLAASAMLAVLEMVKWIKIKRFSENN